MATDDKPGDDQKADNSEDNFGLPDIEYKPLEQSAAETASASASAPEPAKSSSYEPYTPPEEPKSKAPVVLGIIIVLVLVIAGYLIYTFVIQPANEATARKEQAAKEAAAKKKEEEARLARERALEEERKKQEAEANAKPKEGTIETLTGRTKRYYVIVSSDVDDDLLMDFAKKLSAKGISTKVIPPFGGKNFYRLAIADHDTWALAQTNADAAKADYGPAVWVLKY